MLLSIISDGVSLRQRDGCFELCKEGVKKKLSPQRVTSILLNNRCHLTSQALLLAMEHNIDVLLLDHFGDPVGRFWYGGQGRSIRIRRAQMGQSQSLHGILMVEHWLLSRIRSQGTFLKQLLKNRPGKSAEFMHYIDEIEELQKRLEDLFDELATMPDSQDAEKVAEWRALLMGMEGSASRSYFRCISELLPRAFQFSVRSRRPARDPFNAALNYAYGILYGRVERACLLAGLDPYAGFFHADHPYRPALVCDMIEPFRVWAERIVTFLFTRKKLNESHFERSGNGVFLGSSGKELLVPSFHEYTKEKIRVSRRHVPRSSLYLHEAHRLANRLVAPGEVATDLPLLLEEF